MSRDTEQKSRGSSSLVIGGKRLSLRALLKTKQNFKLFFFFKDQGSNESTEKHKGQKRNKTTTKKTQQNKNKQKKTTDEVMTSLITQLPV